MPDCNESTEKILNTAQSGVRAVGSLAIKTFTCHAEARVDSSHEYNV